MWMMGLQAVAQFNITAQWSRMGAPGGCLWYVVGERMVEVGYRQLFMVEGMSDKQIRLQWPFEHKGDLRVGYEHYGNAVYYEQQASVDYAMRVASWLHIGVGAQWMQAGTNDAHYHSRQWVSPSLLLHGHWQKASLTALIATRPWDKWQPVGFVLQSAYRPMQSWTTLLGVDYAERMRWRWGVEYAYDQRFYARAGVSTHPLVLTFGAGVRIKHYSFNLMTEVHRQMITTPQVSMSLWF